MSRSGRRCEDSCAKTLAFPLQPLMLRPPPVARRDAGGPAGQVCHAGSVMRGQVYHAAPGFGGEVRWLVRCQALPRLCNLRPRAVPVPAVAPCLRHANLGRGDFRGASAATFAVLPRNRFTPVSTSGQHRCECAGTHRRVCVCTQINAFAVS